MTEHAGLSSAQPMNNVQRDIVEAYLIPESKFPYHLNILMKWEIKINIYIPKISNTIFFQSDRYNEIFMKFVKILRIIVKSETFITGQFITLRSLD